MTWWRELLWLGTLLGNGIALQGYLNTFDLEIVRTEVRVPGLGAGFDGYRVGLISCLHTDHYGLRERRLRAALQRLEVDVLVVAGDFRKRRARMSDVLASAGRIFEGLRYPDGVIATRGNHDVGPLTEPLRAMGITFLDNDVLVVQRGADVLTFLGVGSARQADPDWSAVLEKVRGVPGPRVGICHSPDGVVSASRRPIELLLCGHTHGGQIRLPFFGPLLTETRLVGRKYASGLHRYGRVQLFVNAGIGWTGLAMRFNCPPQIDVLTLRSAEGAAAATME